VQDLHELGCLNVIHSLRHMIEVDLILKEIDLQRLRAEKNKQLNSFDD